MNNPNEDYNGPFPKGWTGGQHVTKWWQGKHVHLYTVRKPCAECRNIMEISVTKAALEGKVKNAGLHLARCQHCRAKTKALGISSRPKTDAPPFEETPMIGIAAETSVDESLRTANVTMKEEITALYAENKELRQRLAKYEAPRMPWDN